MTRFWEIDRTDAGWNCRLTRRVMLLIDIQLFGDLSNFGWPWLASCGKALILQACQLWWKPMSLVWARELEVIVTLSCTRLALRKHMFCRWTGGWIERFLISIHERIVIMSQFLKREVTQWTDDRSLHQGILARHRLQRWNPIQTIQIIWIIHFDRISPFYARGQETRHCTWNLGWISTKDSWRWDALQHQDWNFSWKLLPTTGKIQRCPFTRPSVVLKETLEMSRWAGFVRALLCPLWLPWNHQRYIHSGAKPIKADGTKRMKNSYMGVPNPPW